MILSRQFLRFFAVSLVGLAIDIGGSWLVLVLLDPPLPVAALVGFTIAAGFNYLQHAFWTFAGSRTSFLGFASYLGLVGTVAALRFVLVTWFETMPVLAPYPLAILIAATAVTFLVSFSLSRTLVFRATAGKKPEETNG